jgi:hypothetical protein
MNTPEPSIWPAATADILEKFKRTRAILPFLLGSWLLSGKADK